MRFEAADDQSRLNKRGPNSASLLGQLKQQNQGEVLLLFER